MIITKLILNETIDLGLFQAQRKFLVVVEVTFLYSKDFEAQINHLEHIIALDYI